MDNSKPFGAFSASNMSKLFVKDGVGFEKTTRTYLLDLAIEIVNQERVQKFSTGATNHGNANQFEAFERVVQKVFTVAEWHDKYIAINDNLGATPDAVTDYSDPCDVKCPYYIDTFFEHKEQLKNVYYWQIQTQMIATGGDIGRFCFYLTTPDTDEFGNKINQYPFPLEDCYFFTEVPKSQKDCDRIITRVEECVPVRDELVDKLRNAPVYDKDEFFYSAFYGKKYRKISKVYNILSDKIKIVAILNNEGKKEFFTESK